MFLYGLEYQVFEIYILNLFYSYLGKAKRVGNISNIFNVKIRHQFLTVYKNFNFKY